MNPEDLPLRDLHLPEMTSWWPPAPGWWFIAALALFAMTVLIRRAYRRWRHNEARRLALRRLSGIKAEFEQGSSAVSLGKALSELTRRAMLAYSPREAVAGLTGDAWLEWLDQGLDDGSMVRFTQVPERADNERFVESEQLGHKYCGFYGQTVFGGGGYYDVVLPGLLDT